MSMTREEFLQTINKLYTAVRKAYGYTEEADKLIDNLEDIADTWEENKGVYKE